MLLGRKTTKNNRSKAPVPFQTTCRPFRHRVKQARSKHCEACINFLSHHSWSCITNSSNDACTSSTIVVWWYEAILSNFGNLLLQNTPGVENLLQRHRKMVLRSSSLRPALRPKWEVVAVAWQKPNYLWSKWSRRGHCHGFAYKVTVDSEFFGPKWSASGLKRSRARGTGALDRLFFVVLCPSNI